MKHDNVVPFTGITKLPMDPDRVLNGAVGCLANVVICGFDHDGDFYFASSDADGAEVLWLLERARHKLMKITDDLEAGS